jgi:hypothetical protein
MRGYSRRAWLAFGVSLAGHAALVVTFLQTRALFLEAPARAKLHVDRRIDGPEGYSPVILRLDEPPPSPAPSKEHHLPIVPNSPIRASAADKQEVARTGGNAANGGPTSTQNDNAIDGATHGVAPLHGKMTTAGASIVYVLDRSGSMGRDRKLARAVALVKASLQQLGVEVRFQIVTYDSQATIARIDGSLEPVVANPANIAAANRQLDDLVGEGSSRHFEGLRAGLGLHPDVLILITDADELSPNEVQVLGKWNAKRTRIHAVLLGEARSDGPSSLRELAGPGRVHYSSSGPN